MAAEAPELVEIRTTITANSLQRNFGLPGNVDYRRHPNERDTELPASVFDSMRTKEIGPLSDLRILKGTIYSMKNRRIISRWLRDVVAAFKLRTTTLCLAAQLTDCFLIKNLTQLPVGHCQLAAIAALWIAAKFEEMDDALPSVRSLVDVCAAAYTREQILDMEESVLENFRWKIPHVTSMNFMYLFLHMHTDANYLKAVRPAPPAAPHPPVIEVALISVHQTTKVRTATPSQLQMKAPLSTSLPGFCAALGVPHTPNVELFLLFGNDLMVARKLDLSATPEQLNFPDKPQLFLSTAASGAIFAERDQFLILRSLNGLMLHISETLIQESVVNVEFLRFPSHVTALAVLAVSRCLAGKNPDEARASLIHIKRELKVSLSMTFAAAEIIVAKYTETLETNPESLTEPVIAKPADISERLAMIFDRQPKPAAEKE